VRLAQLALKVFLVSVEYLASAVLVVYLAFRERLVLQGRLEFLVFLAFQELSEQQAQREFKESLASRAYLESVV
jgi:hypothetical protein